MKDMAFTKYTAFPSSLSLSSWRDSVFKDRLGGICLLLYLLIFSGFFFLETSLHRFVFYLSMPFSILFIKENFALLKTGFLKNKNFTIPLVLFLSYSGLSALWSTPLEKGFTFNETKCVVFLPLSMATLYLILKKIPFAYDFLIKAFVTGALLSGIWLVSDNFLSDSLERLEGLGRAENSVMGSYLYCLALLTVMFAEPMAKIAMKYKIAIGLVFLYVMLLMLSRSPLIVLALSVGIMILVRKNFTHLLIMAVIGFVGMAAFFMAPRDVIPIVNRPDTGRTQVWVASLEKIAEKPVFGHGIATKFYYPIYAKSGYMRETGPHTHNFYLGSLVQGGIISLSFVLYFITLITIKGYRLVTENNVVWPFVIFLSCIIIGFMNFASTLNNLGVIWIAFWYPCIFMISRENDQPVIR